MNKNNDFEIAPGLLKVLNALGINSSKEELESLLNRANFLRDRQTQHDAKMSIRWQDSVIVNLIDRASSVLDIGCGEGDLLSRLADERDCFVQGMEWSEESVLRCIEKGLPVYHNDLEKGLSSFLDNSFDFVILQNTLQTLYAPLNVLREMLRVGKKCVVSFPNFAHWQVRLVFSLGGRMPVTESLPYNWYDTPNIHLCSIEDFMDWCRDDKVNIHASWMLVEGSVLEYNTEHNLSAEEAVFLISSEN